ncbi:MAG: IS1595 family transposase [Alphaproteobacteria bacterium]|nr:IS1595 family transposase [Alphaproteobacteria bacterium]
MSKEYIDWYINHLSTDEKREFANQILREINMQEANTKIFEIDKNNTRCPYCHSNKIVKSGKQNNNQRFYCNECHKKSCMTTKTPIAYSNKSVDVWYKYIGLMCKKLSLREIAKELGINKNTAFLWRHKILNAFSTLNTDKISGIVEADETYFRESQKGSRNLNRKAHKSGKSKLNKFQIMSLYGYTEEEYKAQQHKRGLSKDLICVLTATNKISNVWGKPVGYGKVQPKWIENKLQPMIAKNSILVTDGECSYNHIKNVKHKKFSTGLSKSKTYNLGRIDNIHTSLKRLINDNFRGVATKYLENYVNYLNVMKQGANAFDTLIGCNNYITRNSLKYKVAF